MEAKFAGWRMNAFSRGRKSIESEMHRVERSNLFEEWREYSNAHINSCRRGEREHEWSVVICDLWLWEVEAGQQSAVSSQHVEMKRWFTCRTRVRRRPSWRPSCTPSRCPSRARRTGSPAPPASLPAIHNLQITEIQPLQFMVPRDKFKWTWRMFN